MLQGGRSDRHSLLALRHATGNRMALRAGSRTMKPAAVSSSGTCTAFSRPRTRLARGDPGA